MSNSVQARRAAVGLFEALSSQNRMSGSGGGAGMSPLYFLGQADSAPTIIGISYSEQASVSFTTPPYAARFFFIATVSFNMTDTVGDTEVVTLTLDGNTSPNFGAPDYSPFAYFQTPTGTTQMPPITVAWCPLIAGGGSTHRVSLLIGKTGGTIGGLYYSLYAFQVGA